MHYKFFDILKSIFPIYFKLENFQFQGVVLSWIPHLVAMAMLGPFIKLYNGNKLKICSVCVGLPRQPAFCFYGDYELFLAAAAIFM